LLFLAFLPIVLLPVIVTAASTQWRYQVDRGTVEHAIREDLLQTGATRLKLITGLLSNAQELAQTMALMWPQLREQEDPNAQLQLLIYRSQVFTPLWVVTNEGRIRYSSDPPAIGQQIRLDPYWQEYQQRRSLTFSGLLTDAHGRKVIRILAPLGEDETLVASYNTDQLQAAFRNLKAEQLQRFTVLTDGDGNVIAHSSELAQLRRPNLGSLPPVARALQGYSGTMGLTDPETGAERDAAYLPVSLTGWALVLMQPTATAILTPATTTHRITLLTLAASLIVAIGATMLLSRRLADPITRAGRRLQFLSHEPVSLEHLSSFPGSPIREFDGVQQSIRRLYESLARSILELEAKNHELIFANEQLAASVETFKRLDKLRGDFINILSHDLRIPLTAIIGYAELLEDAPTLSPQEKDYVQQILEGCDRMKGQLDELLDYARMEVGRFKLSLEPVDLNTAIPEILAFFKPIAEREGLTLDLALPEQLPEIWLDPDRLRQILNNLVSNAIKYTPPGGHVTVRARVTEGCLLLEVSDTGIGLTAEDREHLFEKFFRSPRSEVQSEQGSGIGLSLVKGVIEAHGGSIEAEGEPGKGSTFRVKLPIRPPRAEGESA
jgi:signal transduction histidine kinase